MKINKIIDIIKKDKNLVGVKVIYPDKDFSLVKKHVVYNTYQKNYEEGLINNLTSLVRPHFSTCDYIPLYDKKQLNFNFWL